MSEQPDLEPFLNEILEQAAARVASPAEERIRSAVARRRSLRLQRFAVLAAAGALLVAGAGIPLWILAPIGSRAPDQGRTPLDTSSQVSPLVTAVVDVGQSPRSLAVGEEGLWVTTSPGDGTCTAPVHRIDRETNAVVASIPIDVSPTGVAVGAGSIWVVGTTCEEGSAVGGGVVRVDAGSERVVAAFEVGFIPFDVAVGAGAIWITRDIDGRSGELIRIDPATNGITARIPLQGRIRNIAAGEGFLWVTDSTSSGSRGPSVIQVDPVTNQVVAVLDEINGTFVALGGGALWSHAVVEHQSAAVEVDLETGTVSRQIPVRTVFRPFAVGFGGVWFIAGPGSEAAGRGICRLNLATEEVDVCVDHGSTAHVSLEPAALDGQTGSVWVANGGTTVTRIDIGLEGTAGGPEDR